MPTRFKYTKVQSQAFALTPVEILLATDAELNQYMGLRKLAPYRKDSSNWDKNRAARLKEFKTTLQERKAAVGAGEDISKVLPDMPTKKRKGKKERMKAKAAAGNISVAGLEEGEEDTGQTGSRKRKSSHDAPEPVIDVQGGDESAGPPKAKRRRHRKSAKQLGSI